MIFFRQNTLQLKKMIENIHELYVENINTQVFKNVQHIIFLLLILYHCKCKNNFIINYLYNII